MTPSVILCDWLAERDAKLQHFFHSCKPFFVPASVFYFCKIVTNIKSIIYKLPAYHAASVYFLVISEKNSTFATDFKNKICV
jgi:hypothetical protein